MIKIGIFGSCQICHFCTFFLNDIVQAQFNYNIEFVLPSYMYDSNYPSNTQNLDYSIFNKINVLIIEINNYIGVGSSDKIIEYCANKNIKIIKTFLLKFPIFPISWSGYGENYNDYVNWVDLDKIDYKKKFAKCIDSLKNQNKKSDLPMDLSIFIENNFNKQLLFCDSLHPSNVLIYELWKYIFMCLDIDINEFNYSFDKNYCGLYNPFTTKMITDLDIQFEIEPNDDFYIDRYNKNKYDVIHKVTDNQN